MKKINEYALDIRIEYDVMIIWQDRDTDRRIEGKRILLKCNDDTFQIFIKIIHCF